MIWYSEFSKYNADIYYMSCSMSCSVSYIWLNYILGPKANELLLRFNAIFAFSFHLNIFQSYPIAIYSLIHESIPLFIQFNSIYVYLFRSNRMKRKFYPKL